MAHVVSLTDGTTTLNFTLADGRMIVNYDMKRDGNDTVECHCEAASKPALQALIEGIEAMGVIARRRAETKRGAKVYINFQVDGESSSNRSFVKNLEVELDESLLRSGFANMKGAIRVFVERDPWWEGPETELQLASIYPQSERQRRRQLHPNRSGANHRHIANAGQNPDAEHQRWRFAVRRLIHGYQ